MPDGLVDTLLAEARAAHLDLSRLGVAWARVLPTALVLPAFGLGFVTVPVRVAVALGLALVLTPGIPPVPAGEPWLVSALGGFARGVPVALVASVTVWAAMVAGGVADTAVGSARLRQGGTPLAKLLGLFAAVAFFETGGAARLLARLAQGTGGGLEAAVSDLAAGVSLGAAVSAPLLVVAIVVDVANGLVGRESGFAEQELAALRALVLTVGCAALFERVAEGLVVFGVARP